MSDNATLLAARVFLVTLFFVSGFGMLSAPGATAGYFGSLGIPLPGLVVWLVIALKVIAGLAILFGIQTRYAAWGLALFCIAAPLFGHSNFAEPGQMSQFLKDIALAGGFLALSVAGPGRLSVAGARA
jgi:putative oxidoreductase